MPEELIFLGGLLHSERTCESFLGKALTPDLEGILISPRYLSNSKGLSPFSGLSGDEEVISKSLCKSFSGNYQHSVPLLLLHVPSLMKRGAHIPVVSYQSGQKTGRWH